MKQNSLQQISAHGQNIWLDFFDRQIMDDGQLQKLITEDGLSGITSNPSIFEKAVHSSADYDEDIRKFSSERNSPENIFFSFAIEDIKRAADMLLPVYEAAGGTDGFVSIEVSPRLAHDTKGTIEQARDLWKAAGRKNVMVKIPATAEGLPAIQQCIEEGININITLLFGLERYSQVIEAYMKGLKKRLVNGEPVNAVASVASFFLSRIDVLLDPMLEEKGLGKLKGTVAIALAKTAYQMYKDAFYGQRFDTLRTSGAKVQKLLWASTSTKDPSFSDVKYVEALIGTDTINTLPLETIDAFRDHGKAESMLESDLDGAANVLDQLEKNGIDLNRISQQLEDEGVQKFDKAYDALLTAVASKKEATTA